MARFYGTIIGGRGKATRLGTEASGIEVGANAWHVGVDVSGRVDGEGGADFMDVFATTGSSSDHMSRHIATVRDIGGGNVSVSVYAQDGSTLATYKLQR